MKAYNMRELAERTGVGKSTVQRVITGSTKVSAKTKERVLKAAEEAGYQPDVYFSSLSAKRHLSGNKRGGLVHYIYGSPKNAHYDLGVNIIEYYQENAGKFGYKVEPVGFTEFKNVDQITQKLYARGSWGLIVAMTDPILHPGIKAYGKLPILLNQRQTDMPYHTVRFGVSNRMRMCWEKLWEAGYRRIGCAVLSHDPILDDDRDRYGTALALLDEFLPPKQRIPPLRTSIVDNESYLRWVQQHKPEAVICFQTGFWYYHNDSGFHHIPFVSLHASQPGSKENHQIPGTYDYYNGFANEGLRQLDSMIRHAEVGIPETNLDIVFPPKWNDGEGIPRYKRSVSK